MASIWGLASVSSDFERVGDIMRFKSDKVGGFRIFAVSGTNTISFGIDFDPGAAEGLIGFAIEREDLDPNRPERYYVYGFKVFESIYPRPDETLRVTTFDHPVQSFVWDDFTARDGQEYVYYFHPLKGTPKNLDRSARPIPIKVRTEKLFSNEKHDIFFNRGVASSQAYAREFGNKQPDQLPEPDRARALQWLSRYLDEAIIAFIDQAQAGDTLLGAFYEFRYKEVAQRLKAALDRGVDVRLVIDGKKNGGGLDRKGEPVPDFPRADNIALVDSVGLTEAVTWREKNRNAIAHNKFMVLLRGIEKQPSEVWTGSTNLSDGGIHGQTNVGHWVRDADVARHFREYWTLLSADPGKPGTGTRPEETAAMTKLRTDVAALLPTPTDWRTIAPGTTPVFSPRASGKVLDMYSTMFDESGGLGCVTLAFGISAVFKERLVQNDSTSPISFLLLEKKDEPPRAPRNGVPKPFVRLGAKQNVYAAWGSFIKDPLFQWALETNAGKLKLNQHVSYIHSKFLLHDPLGADPIVVTGSANFSAASTNDNDENMLLIRGEPRVADIYFTEFNRLFFHYYFRSVHEETSSRRSKGEVGITASAAQKSSLFLDETAGWVTKYAPGSLKTKRVKMFTAMANAVTLAL